MSEHEREADHSEIWRAILMGEARGLEWTKKLVGWIPAGPRCKLCLAPLKAPGSVILRPFGFGPSALNRRLCRACFKQIDKLPGGAEVELSLLFADVRGSTGLAERMPAHEFSRLISRFYGAAGRVVDNWNGLIDKFVGDEVWRSSFLASRARIMRAAQSVPPESSYARRATTGPTRGYRSAQVSTRASPSSEASGKETTATSRPWVTP